MAAPMRICRRYLIQCLHCRKNLNFISSSRYFSTDQEQDSASTGTSFSYRTHLCGELTRSHVGQTVRLSGWLQYHRLSGAFIVLRDWQGLIQLLIPQHKVEETQNFPLESVLEVTGDVQLRPPGQENESMSTGDVEVAVKDIKVLNPCKTNLPFEVRTFNKVKENLRIKHRYLELRLPHLQHALRLRSQFVMALRNFLAHENEFVEVETPTLFRRTPGGAREFIVPTHSPGKFYSLPQSPQQFKQLLMVGGVDRYFQIARCYRDEGSKPDRQPEFTQVDLEMSFVSQEDVVLLVERLLERSWPGEKGEVKGPFPHMTYHQAMTKYGCDKPDLRLPWQVVEVTDLVRDSCPPVFQPYLETPGASIQALRVKDGVKHLSNKQLDALKQSVFEKVGDSVKLVPVKVRSDETWGSGVGQQLGDSVRSAIQDRLDVAAGDLLVFAAGQGFLPHTGLGLVRLQSADMLEAKGFTVREDGFHFLWVDTFPLFLPKEDGSPGLESAHHPFTAPHPEDVGLVYTAPEQVRSQHYDLVLNGSEIGGGSIRVHDSHLQRYILQTVLQENCSELEHLLEALDSGCPPHGGIALGLDRLMAIMLGTDSIRDVIAFPKVSEGHDPLSRAPAAVAEKDLDYYNIHLVNLPEDGGSGV
ncbi:aspartate--tRNA ligase, mitochondrial [Aplysia californica]|uniref:Aspartate--tRNA ligase, mitochondrial n=1 Tax=Aplysia californica TaxID=6500 RepID=A0ABM1A969_APLCA|nr:aspartate--tRNA ligase, mitochondrial [Aplysia californica]